MGWDSGGNRGWTFFYFLFTYIFTHFLFLTIVVLIVCPFFLFDKVKVSDFSCFFLVLVYCAHAASSGK